METSIDAATRRVPQVSILRPGNARIPLRLIGPTLIVAAAAVAVAPQLVRGNSCGHDFNVHLVSWLDCVNAWRHGIAYPHWTPSANWDAGEPRFVFYPPLTWIVGAALGLMLPWALAPIVLTFLILAGTGLATRALAREACNDAVATLAGCAAIFSGFALFTAYERAAFPEFMGSMLLPLVVLFALRERQPNTAVFRRALDGSAAPLALVLGACWLSNAPLGVMASYLMAAMALTAAVLRRTKQRIDWAPVLRATIAAVVGLGATAFYWIPAALEQRWVDIRQATQDPGYNFENSWLFARHTNPDLALHDVVLHTASVISISMIAVALLCGAVAWRRGTLTPERTTGSRSWWIPIAAIPVAVLFLLFPISRPVWDLLPKMKFLQYPWRWMEAVEAPMAILFAAAVWPRTKRTRGLVCGVCALAFLAALGYAVTEFFQVCHPEDTVRQMLTDYRNGAGFEGMYEYEPPAADIGAIAMGLPDACLVSDPSTELGRQDDNDNLVWNAAQGSCEAVFSGTPPVQRANPEHRQINAIVPRAGYLVLRLLSYPAWRVRVNGRTVTNLPRRDDGLIAVPVPQGAVDVTADWTITPDVILSRWICCAGILLLILLYVFESKLRRGAPRIRTGRPRADRRLYTTQKENPSALV